MAATLISLRTSPTIPSASSHRRPPRRKSPSANWRNPLFSWPSNPDCIDGDSESNKDKQDATRVRSRLAAGSLTEEKARELRMKTMEIETETFHDAMYHSAIASRLASDLPGLR